MDLLTWPLLGPFLKWRHARTAMQVPLLLSAALIVFDGLVGPQLAPKNLATVGVWLHYRGLVVLALLLAGNLFCMACPFMLPRQAARWLRERFGRGGRAVPRWLRGKWLAIGLVALFFFAYELFDLWATPWWTAWVAVGYFVVAFAVDATFRGAAFCKHVCPLGQFNFFGSLISPLEIKVREAAVCAGCRTKDCITAGKSRNSRNLGNLGETEGSTPSTSSGQALSGGPHQFAARSRRARSDLPTGPHPFGELRAGSSTSAGGLMPASAQDAFRVSLKTASARPDHGRAPLRTLATSSLPSEGGGRGVGLRGCELALFQERKVGNMDCTFCLDCVHACPYDNVGLIARRPTAELWADPFRSGVGRFSQRVDLATLVVVFTFGAYLNAFAMIRPVYAVQEGLARWLGTAFEAPGLALLFVIGLVVLPGSLLALAGLGTRILGGLQGVSLRSVILRYVYALVPMGFGMWLAHYTFHFLTGGLTIVPVVQSFLADVGLYAGQPAWGLGPLVPPDWLFPIEAALLYLGAFGSIIVAFRIAAVPQSSGLRNPAAVLAAAAPWMLLTLALLGFGLWILVQPMEMRGTMQMLTGG